MTQPIYTTVDTGAAVPGGTAGPADEKAPLRVKGYTVLSALLSLIPVLTVFKVITTEQGVAIGQFVQSGIGLAGAFGFAFVAAKTQTQIKNHTFDKPVKEIVPVPTAPPETTAAEAIATVATAFEDLVGRVQSGLATVGGAVGAVSAVTQVLPALGDLGSRDDLAAVLKSFND